MTGVQQHRRLLALYHATGHEDRARDCHSCTRCDIYRLTKIVLAVVFGRLRGMALHEFLFCLCEHTA
jgi:hypothetical protein